MSVGSSGHTYRIRATGGGDRHRDWSHPVVQLCVEKVPLTIRLSSRGQKYIFSTARIISSPWRVFPAGRTRHDSCSPGSGRGRGQVWMVVLGNQPVQPACNQDAPEHRAGVRAAGRFDPLLCRNSQIHRGKRCLLRQLSLFPRRKKQFHCWSSEIPRRKNDFRRGISQIFRGRTLFYH